MNRKQKLIISITGITIVMLALLGLTYGYYLTRIQGNTNTNSISITTADLTLKYDDGSSYINLTNIMPGTTTDGEGDNPLPKIFTVTNDGSGDVEYSVGMDEVTNTLTRTQDLTYSITCQEKLITTADTEYTACATTPSNSGEYPKTNSYLFTNQIKQDYIQKYTVVISYANPDEDQSVDMGSTIKGRMQIYSVPESIDITGTVTGASSGDYVQINSNPKTSIIAEDGTYKLIGIEPGTHTLKVMNGSTTKGTKEIIVKQGTTAGIDGNTITFTESERVATVNVTSISTNLGVNITEIKDENLLLKDAIIANAQKAASENSTTKTIYSETPLTTPALATSGETERTLSLTTDDYGDSYYFRGNVDDNYVNFAGMCWRIVRIAGDDTIKLILDDKEVTCNSSSYTGNWVIGEGPYGYIESEYTNYMSEKVLLGNLINSDVSGMADALENFQTTKLSNYIKYLKYGDWCYEDETYDSYGNAIEVSNSNYKTSLSIVYHAGYLRTENEEATLHCQGEMLEKFGDGTNMYVGALVTDEAIYAGHYKTNYNSNVYLLNNYQATITPRPWLFMSPARFHYSSASEYALYYTGMGNVQHVTCIVSEDLSYRPVINLVANIKTSGGDGTQSNPYLIK